MSSGEYEAEPAARQRQLLRQAAVQRYRVKLADEVVEGVHARAEEDVFAVVLPAHDDVVRSHAVGDVVAAERGGVGEAARHAALGGHDVDLGVAVVLAGEGDPLAVRREAGETSRSRRGWSAGGPMPPVAGRCKDRRRR